MDNLIKKSSVCIKPIFLAAGTNSTFSYGDSYTSVLDTGTNDTKSYFWHADNGSGNVQGSNDNSTWVNVETITSPGSNSGVSNPSSTWSQTIGQGTYRYWRAKFKAYNNGRKGTCSISVGTSV